MKKTIFVALALLICGYITSLKAQDQISNIFKAGITDLNTVANGYLKPAGNSFSAALGSNWYNTAAVHKTWGFDLTIGGSVVMSPKSDQMFDLTGLTNLKPTIAGTTQAPSFAGKGSGVELNLMQPHYLADGTTMNPLWNNGTGKIVSFTTPKGVSRYIPAPTVQFTIGLPVINDVSVRWMPTVKASDAEVSMWGIGVKHNFKQWIPGMNLLPFDASVLVAYTHFDAKYAFNTTITPRNLVSDQSLLTTADLTDNTYGSQGMHMFAKAFTTGIVISKKLAFFTPYAGIGFIKTNYDLTMTGTYPTVAGLQMVNSTLKAKINKATDPVKVTGSETMPNATFGFRLKFALLSIHAQYVAQKYATASAGFGFTFR